MINANYKKRFYDKLIDWVSDVYQPAANLIITGDFNIAPEACDVFDVDRFENVPTYHPEEHKRWTRLLEWGLEDIGRDHIPQGMYTFWDYRAGSFQRNLGMRIDHFLGTKTMKQRTVSAQVIRDFRKKKDGLKASDHAPVELVLKD